LAASGSGTPVRWQTAPEELPGQTNMHGSIIVDSAAAAAAAVHCPFHERGEILLLPPCFCEKGDPRAPRPDHHHHLQVLHHHHGAPRLPRSQTRNWERPRPRPRRARRGQASRNGGLSLAGRVWAACPGKPTARNKMRRRRAGGRPIKTEAMPLSDTPERNRPLSDTPGRKSQKIRSYGPPPDAAPLLPPPLPPLLPWPCLVRFARFARPRTASPWHR